MSNALHFHSLRITRISPEAAGAVAVTFEVPAPLRATFAFQPGQFLTLRATVNGSDERRCYSICSTPTRLAQSGELEVGIRPMAGGAFSNWAAQQLGVGDTLAVLPPQGRFVSQRPRARHRVGFAAGSGITPILSIIASTLEQQTESKFTLVYGNRRMDSVMFNEALQDLKDRYPNRLTLIHILSRQAQEVDLLQGRIDADKIRALTASLLPAASMDEVFICGPEAMIDATQASLLAQGVPARQVHTERFTSPALEAMPTTQRQAALASALDTGRAQAGLALGGAAEVAPSGEHITLSILLDGKTQALTMRPNQRVLDVALAAGLDLPYSCKAGVCCTCRAKVLEGSVSMAKNFTLEPWEMAQGFVLTCQACPTSARLVVSYDER